MSVTPHFVVNMGLVCGCTYAPYLCCYLMTMVMILGHWEEN